MTEVQKYQGVFLDKKRNEKADKKEKAGEAKKEREAKAKEELKNAETSSNDTAKMISRKGTKKEISDSDSDKPVVKKSKWAKFLKSDGDFKGWKISARQILESKNGTMRKNKMLKKIWKIYKKSNEF